MQRTVGSFFKRPSFVRPRRTSRFAPLGASRDRSAGRQRITSLLAMGILVPAEFFLAPIAHEGFLPTFAVVTSEAKTPSPRRPVRVRIPKIGVDAAVMPVGLIAGTRKADVPADGRHVGWYSPGPRPGEEGNAVLDGHLNVGGQPGVFFDLRHLQEGDAILVEDEQGTERSFRVREAHVYFADEGPMQKIFGKTDGKHLNLITCAGTWREELDHYDERLVIYTDAI